MKTDELKIITGNLRERLDEFADIIGDLLGINEFEFTKPEKNPLVRVIELNAHGE